MTRLDLLQQSCAGNNAHGKREGSTIPANQLSGYADGHSLLSQVELSLGGNDLAMLNSTSFSILK
jgi:hypothetical protein